MKKYKCPNHLQGCPFFGSRDEVIKHLKNGSCRQQHAIIYQDKPDYFFDGLLAGFVINEMSSDNNIEIETPSFESGGGNFSGAGASGSWDSPSVDSSPSDSSSFDISSSDCSSGGSGGSD